MENFLASRPAVAKLGSHMKNLSGGTFAPLLAKGPESASAPAPHADLAKTPAPSSKAEPANEPHTHAVQVEVVRENGAVQGIVVTCRCGERIELECLY